MADRAGALGKHNCRACRRAERQFLLTYFECSPLCWIASQRSLKWVLIEEI